MADTHSIAQHVLKFLASQTGGLSKDEYADVLDETADDVLARIEALGGDDE